MIIGGVGQRMYSCHRFTFWFLVLKPTLEECYSKDMNTWINHHSTLSSIVDVHVCLGTSFVFKLYFECIVPKWLYINAVYTRYQYTAHTQSKLCSTTKCQGIP